MNWSRKAARWAVWWSGSTNEAFSSVQTGAIFSVEQMTIIGFEAKRHIFIGPEYEIGFDFRDQAYGIAGFEEYERCVAKRLDQADNTGHFSTLEGHMFGTHAECDLASRKFLRKPGSEGDLDCLTSAPMGQIRLLA